MTQSRSAAGNSYTPIFSADGRFLVFVSQANNLVTNDDLGLNLDVFVRDLTNQTTTLVSVNTNGVGGGDFDANCACISSNGQWIAFASAASNLVPNDTNKQCDVFVRDMVAGTTRLVSVDFSGVASANGDSTAPLISADGRWVIFESTATNLANFQFTTNCTQVYARDLLSNVTYLVSVDASGTKPADGRSEMPAISADGRRVAFVSQAPDIVHGVTNQQGEVFLRDLESMSTTWASSNAASFLLDSANGYRCLLPELSRDGNHLAYKAEHLDNFRILVFCRDCVEGETFLITTNSYKASSSGFSADGHFLVSSRILPNRIILWDTQQKNGTNIQITIGGFSASGKVSGISDDAIVVVSSESGYAASQPVAFNLASNTVVQAASNLVGYSSKVDMEGSMPALSPDGRLVAFECPDDNLIGEDNNRSSDIFIKNLETGELELISVRHDGKPARTATGHLFVDPLCLSGDGRFALLASSDNALGTLDTNRVIDLYLVDIIAGTNKLITAPTNSRYQYRGEPAFSFPIISRNAQSIACLRGYSTTIGSLTMEGFLLQHDIGLLTYFNLNPTGGVAVSAIDTAVTIVNLSRFGMAFSSDGQRLAFSGLGAELMFGTGTWYNNIYLHDVAGGSNTLVTRNYSNPNQGGTGNSSLPQFSPDDRWLTFASEAANLVSNGTFGVKLWAWDLENGTKRMVMPASTNWGFSPDSRYIALATSSPTTNIYLHDLYAATPTNILVSSNARNPSVSMNAEVIAFQTMPTNSITHVFAKHIPTDKMELISVAPDGVTPGNGASEPPQITPDGRFALFASKANNLVPNDTNNCSDIFLRDRQLGLTYLLSANPKTARSGNRPSTNPLMSADGSTIIFASLASDLAEGDYNDKQDVFVVKLARGDSDSDGLDDAWEMAYFGNLALDGSGDADGDGLKDREEYRAGTDPTNQGSVLRALAVAPVGGQSTTLMWPAANGRQYQIQFKRNVTDTNWTELPATITVIGNTASAVDTQAGFDAARFYRILILP